VSGVAEDPGDAPPDRGDGRVLHLVSVAACVPFLWIVTWVVLDPVVPSDRYPRGVAIALAALALLLAPLVVRLLGRAVPWLERRPVARRAAVAATLVGVGGVQVRTGSAVRFPPGWDAGVMETLAHGLAFDYLPPEQAVLSINQYPNNALLTAILARWLELFRWAGVDNPDLSYVVLNALVMCASIGLAYAVARRIASPLTAYVTLLLAAAMMTLSPWIGVAYSDTLGMVFPIAVAWLYTRLHGASSRPAIAALWFAMALVGSLGYQIKPTAVFALGAAALVSLLRMRWRSWSRPATTTRAVTVGALVAGFLLGGVVGERITDGVGITPTAASNELAMPLTHFLMMGAQSSSYYGSYWGDDVALTMSVPAGEQRFWNGVRVYRERVGEMGPLGYATFLHKKASWTFGDGSFFAYGEGGMGAEPTPYRNTDPLSRSIQRWMGPHGEHFGLVLAWWQVVWLAVLALVALPAAWWRRDLSTPATTMLRVALVMLLVFLLLFETRPRYLYLYLPYFVVLAAVTAVALSERFDRALRRKVPGEGAGPASCA
jgi:hypothetical protein